MASVDDSTQHDALPLGYAYPSLKYINNVVTSNYACSEYCPHIVYIPTTTLEVASIVRHAVERNYSVSVLGGGHSYTCSGVKSHGVLINMRNMRHISLTTIHNTQRDTQDSAEHSVEEHGIVLGTGLRWSQVLPFLRRHSLIVVHGQCTSVGIAGYSLNGGVHFGGLSALFGLSAENILAASVVLHNGSVAHVQQNNCTVDNAIVVNNDWCTGLLRTLKGSGGSSIGVVTSLTLKTHPQPRLATYLAVLSINTNTSDASARAILDLFARLPTSVSTTLFGLDAYFKAAVFVLKFSKYKLKLVSELNAHPRSKSAVHFILEFSWLKDSNTTLRFVQSICESIVLSDDGIISNAIITAWTSTKGELWSVESYNQVWGYGHSYGGASITINKELSLSHLTTAFISYNMHLRQHSCSDCAIVLHRVTPRIRNTDFHRTSINPSLASAYLWIEMDCGHFYRSQSSWPQCSAFIAHAQSQFDSLVEVENTTLSGVCHYPNVPNLHTKDWKRMYYGINIVNLLESKLTWDPLNVFHHQQSIQPSSATSLAQDKSTSQCSLVYRLKALLEMSKLFFRGGAVVVLIVSLTKYVLTKVTQYAVRAYALLIKCLF